MKLETKEVSSSAQPESLLLSPEVLDRAQAIMTAFGLWLDEKGYGSASIIDNYSNPDVVAERLRRTDATYFQTGALDNEGELTEVTAYPITHFQDITGTPYLESGFDKRTSYEQHEKRLSASLGALACLSRMAKSNPSYPATELRKQIVDILNNYAVHNDGEKEVVSGKHFATTSANTIAGRQPSYWLGRLLVAEDSSRFPLSDEVAEEKLLKAHKTTIADQFIYQALLHSRENEGLIQALSGVHGYLAISQILFAGAMQKPYLNISAVAKMTGQAMPEGWQAFNGTTTEFQQIKDMLGDVGPGLAGYLAVADEQFAGNMQKAYLNISAVAKMTGQAMPGGWQQFRGSTSEFNQQMLWLEEAIAHDDLNFDKYYGKFSKNKDSKDEKRLKLNYAALRAMTC